MVVENRSSNRFDQKSTAVTYRRYQRIARFYDLMQLFPERRFQPWRKQLWSLVVGHKKLEIGVGTGRNIEYQPANRGKCASGRIDNRTGREPGTG